MIIKKLKFISKIHMLHLFISRKILSGDKKNGVPF